MHSLSLGKQVSLVLLPSRLLGRALAKTEGVCRKYALCIHTQQCSSAAWISTSRCCQISTSPFLAPPCTTYTGQAEFPVLAESSFNQNVLSSAVKAGQVGCAVHPQQHLSALLQAAKAGQAGPVVCLISSTCKWCPSFPSIIQAPLLWYTFCWQ